MTTSEELKSLGKSLAKLRIDQNIQQANLAYEAGISVRTLQRLENGENVRVDALLKILQRVGRLRALNETLNPPLPPYQLARQQKNKRSNQKRRRVRTPRTRNQVREPIWVWPEDKE